MAGSVDIGLPKGQPIVYLPGVSRSVMRAADSCPPQLAPIAGLQYRSQWFSHPNKRDWTVRALLSHTERGLGLRLADDADTSQALLLALDRLVDERVDRVERQVLDADYLLELVNEDPVWSVLRWLDDPPVSRRTNVSSGSRTASSSTSTSTSSCSAWVRGRAVLVARGVQGRVGERRLDHGFARIEAELLAKLACGFCALLRGRLLANERDY